MTPYFEQEAERIIKGYWDSADDPELARRIAQALRAAYEKGLEDQPKSGIRRTVAFKEGFEAAKSMAAKVAKEFKFIAPPLENKEDELVVRATGLHISGRIRALTPEGKR